jgi:hypothetical protein
LPFPSFFVPTLFVFAKDALPSFLLAPELFFRRRRRRRRSLRFVSTVSSSSPLVPSFFALAFLSSWPFALDDGFTKLAAIPLSSSTVFAKHWSPRGDRRSREASPRVRVLASSAFATTTRRARRLLLDDDDDVDAH